MSFGYVEYRSSAVFNQSVKVNLGNPYHGSHATVVTDRRSSNTSRNDGSGLER